MAMSCAVGVATRDRPQSLARLMDVLLAQTRRPAQVVVIDDGRLADDWVTQWSARCAAAGVELVYRRKERPGRSASRNLAAELARTDAICYMDDDCEPAADFLDKLLSPLSAGPWAAVEGRIEPAGGAGPGHRAFSRLMRLARWWNLAERAGSEKLHPLPLGEGRVAAGDSPWRGEGASPNRVPGRADHGGHSEPPSPQLSPNGRGGNVMPRPVLCGVCAVRREAVLAEPFDPTLSHGEDNEWSVRIARRFGPLGRVEDAVCIHHLEPAGRAGAFAANVRLARSYLFSQSKLFGSAGSRAAAAGLLVLAFGQLGLGLAGCVLARGSGVAYLLGGAGVLAGLLTPSGPRSD